MTIFIFTLVAVARARVAAVAAKEEEVRAEVARAAEEGAVGSVGEGRVVAWVAAMVEAGMVAEMEGAAEALAQLKTIQQLVIISHTSERK
jgi:hypothetical protein